VEKRHRGGLVRELMKIPKRNHSNYHVDKKEKGENVVGKAGNALKTADGKEEVTEGIL